MSKNTQVNDADVEALLAKLDAPAEADAALPNEISPVTPAPEVADETEAALTEPKGEATAEDERPIVINLPPRQDPTQLLVADGIPQVQVLDANGNLVNDPADRPDVTVSQVTSPQVSPGPPAVPAATIVSPVAEINPADELPDEVKAILKEFSVAAWLNTDDPAKPYWGIRNGPRRGGVPVGASVEDWRGRCASISA